MNFTMHAQCFRQRISQPITKIFALLMLLTAMNIGVLHAQTLNFSFKNTPLDKVIAEVAKKSGYEFVFDAAHLKGTNPLTLDIKSANLSQTLEQIFSKQNFSYEITGKVIILKPKVIAQSAGTYWIKGVVKDSTESPMAGVIVRIKDQKTAVQTNSEGLFTIQLDDKHNSLLFNFIGYKERELTLPRSNSTGLINVTLYQSPSLLMDVVVNGFQNLSRERSTGAATTIDSATLNRQLNVDLLSALEGRVAGLMYTKNPNGLTADQPVLRGIGTFSNTVGTSPLIVIDGLPTEVTLDQVNPYDVESITVLKDAAAASIYGSRSGNGVIVIATKSGKGNGVKITANADLFITGKPGFESMHYASTSDLIDYETAVYNQERARYASTDAMFNYYGNVGNGLTKYYTPLYELYRLQSKGSLSTAQVNNTLNQWRQNDYYQDYADNVWQNEVRQRYNLSFSSNGAKSSNFLSLNYDATDERMKYNNSKNFTLYNKSTFNLKKWLTATIGINAAYNTSVSSSYDYTNYQLQPRYQQITDGNGNLVYSDYVNLSDGFSSSLNINPAVITSLAGNSNFKSFRFNMLDAIQEGQMNTKAINLRTFANIKANIYDGLSFSTQFQYENKRNDGEQFFDKNSYRMRYAYNAMTSYANNIYTHNLPEGGRFYQSTQQSTNYTFRNQLNYDKIFGNKENEHAIVAIAGFEMRQTLIPRTIESLRYGYDPVTLSSTLLDLDRLNNTGIASYIYGNRTLGVPATKQSQTKHRYLSAYSNMSYTFRSKYNLTGSVRVDQTDLFGVDPKYKNNPQWSVGLGWNASNEDFLSNLAWLSLLKVRATYGLNGNVDQGSSPYLTATIRSDGLFPALQYTNIVALPNPKLRWERIATTNFGIDYALFQNRLRGSIDIYNKYSTDLLVNTELDPTVGTASRMLNNGALRNRGIEFSVSGEWLKQNDLTFSSSIVIGFNRNKVQKVNNAVQSAASYITSPRDYFFLDQPINSVYAYKYGGMVNGYPYFLDENGQSNVTFDASGTPTAVKSINNSSAIVNMGTLIPLYNGSVSQRISYKNFDISALLVFSGGNKLRKDVTDLSSTTVYDQDINQRWTNGNTPDLPRIYVDYPTSAVNFASTLSTLWKYSDAQILDASYIKLRNVSLSYTLPNHLSKTLHVSQVRMSAQVNNLWYWSAAGDDIDPETYSLNSGTRSLEIPKSFLFGLNVTF
ncbi:SusC/RagA family TonB-linked outer membrane protein [Pedobacter sp. AW1-32]|uniref:SusC/RagA family TonB-linked outer membrane protein n=1 Tax=Pedobacter sp. AW1-32 TaxID=3383026 RepID=UPI003FEFBB74